MRVLLLVLFLVCCLNICAIQCQILSRLLAPFLFGRRHEDDDYPRPYRRRRPPPRRRHYKRRPSADDPYKYDPDDHDYHKEHDLPPPPPRRPPTVRRQKEPGMDLEQDKAEDNPLVIYLQPGANGDVNRPKKIRIVTMNSFPSFHREFGYGQNHPYHTGQWNKGVIKQDIIFPQNQVLTAETVQQQVDPSQNAIDYGGPQVTSDQQQGYYGSAQGQKFDYDYYKKRRK